MTKIAVAFSKFCERAWELLAGMQTSIVLHTVSQYDEELACLCSFKTYKHTLCNIWYFQIWKLIGMVLLLKSSSLSSSSSSSSSSSLYHSFWTWLIKWLLYLLRTFNSDGRSRAWCHCSIYSLRKERESVSEESFSENCIFTRI
jgi:hypothetical protein